MPGGRFATESLADVPRLSRALAVVFGGAVDDVIDAAGDEDWTKMADRARRWSTLTLRSASTTLEMIGLEHVDPDQSYVIASLHEGFADAVALLQLPLPLAWVARDELTAWRRLGRFLETPAAVTLCPEEPRRALRKLLREAPSVFDSGRSMVVFPQGTLLGIEAAFAPGAFHLASRFRRPLLPVVITGSHRVYEYPFSPLVRFGETIRLEVLPPVPGQDAVESMGAVEKAMREVAMTVTPGPRRFRPEVDGWWDGYAFEISDDFQELKAAVEMRRRRRRGLPVGAAQRS